MIPDQEILLITFISFFSGMVTSAFGFGAGLVLTPLLTFIMPIKDALGISSLVFLVTSASKAFIYFQDIHWPTYRKGLLIASGGLFFGFFIVTKVNTFYLEKLFAIVLLWFAWNTYSGKDTEKSRIPTVLFPALGGVMSVLVHGGGAFFFRYCRILKLDRFKTVATLAGVHFTLNIGKAVFFTKAGFVSIDYIWKLLPAYVTAVIGTRLGKTILKKHLDENKFSIGVAILFFVLSVKMML